MNIKRGQYFYVLHRGAYRIYVCGRDGCMAGSPAQGEMPFNTREEARKRVYELNGWN